MVAMVGVGVRGRGCMVMMGGPLRITRRRTVGDGDLEGRGEERLMYKVCFFVTPHKVHQKTKHRTGNASAVLFCFPFFGLFDSFPRVVPPMQTDPATSYVCCFFMLPPDTWVFILEGRAHALPLPFCFPTHPTPPFKNPFSLQFFSYCAWKATMMPSKAAMSTHVTEPIQKTVRHGWSAFMKA